jgi:dipeptidase E
LTRRFNEFIGVKKMKLYLSSLVIPNSKELFALLPKNGSLSVAIIPNAWDVYPKEKRQPEIDGLQKTFSELGITPKLIDIANIQGDKLQAELAEHSLVWVMGGNSFYLAHLVNQAGMASFLPSLLEQDLVYGGESAGAVLACPTLHGVELLDDPKEAPEVIWDGLGLVDFGIVPHWGMEKYAELLEKCKVEMEKYVKVRTLTNDQAISVLNEEINTIEKE